MGSERRGRGGGGGDDDVDDADDVDVGVGVDGGDAHDSRLTSLGATSQHSRQSAVSGPGAQCDHYRHSQLQLYTVTQSQKGSQSKAVTVRQSQ